MNKKYYNRNIDKYLVEWKDDSNRKPLLLRGARQVGKSSAVRNFAKHFKYYIEVNFERDTEIATLFTGNLRPKEIASRLGVYYGVPVIPGKTLIFFDEIQSCVKAIHSLWFFYEDYPELHIIAAGSLLEFALKKMESFGVGRVRSLFMYPMSFDEFLIATGHELWLKEKQDCSPTKPVFESLHNKLVEAFRNYLLIGGMPEAVSMWVSTGDYLKCNQIHMDIIQTYEDDFSKYERRADPLLLRNTLHSIINQVGGKFVFSNVEGGYRTDKVKESLELLENAGLICPVIHSASNGLPLGAEINSKFIKYLYLDSGLLLSMLGIGNTASQSLFKETLMGNMTDLVNKGHITEMVAGTEILKYSNPNQRQSLYYWQNLSRGAQAEVDYVIAKGMKVVPIEIKSGTKGSMKSMYQFMENKGVDYGIRCSLENFGRVGNVDVIPVYALACLFEGR
ncbi:MAG: ATP-binding protein [Muribaculaceae bacterium]